MAGTLTGANRGSSTNSTGATSVAIVPGSNFTSGAMAVLTLAYDNEGGIDNYSSITDSVGNTWTSQLNAIDSPGGADQDGVCLRIFTCPQDIGQITTGTTITVNFGAVSVVDKAWTLTECAADTGSVKYTYQASSNSAGTTAATITSVSVEIGQMIVGCYGVEGGGAGNVTPDSDTTNGSWSTEQYADGGSGTGNISAFSQYKIVTATATQTYNVGTPNTDRVIAYIILSPSPTIIGTNLGVSRNEVAGTSYGITAPNCTAGALVLLGIAYQNAGTNGADPFNSLTDSVGNTWTSYHNQLADPGAADAGTTLRLFITNQDVATLTSSNTVTIDFGAFSVTEKAWTFTEFTSSLGSHVTYVTGGGSSLTANTAQTITSGSIPYLDTVFVVQAADGQSGTIAMDSDTTRGEWSTKQASQDSFNEINIGSQFKAVLATGTQSHTYNLNGSANDLCGIWVELTEVIRSIDPIGISGFFGH